MIQQVNLYQPILRREQKIFSAMAMLQISAIFLAALIAVSVWQTLDTHAVEQRLTTFRHRNDVATRRLSALVDHLASRKVSPALHAALQQARRKLQQRRAALRVMHRQAQGNTKGFSVMLNALGNTIENGLWLTHVKLAHGGKSIQLSGQMSRATELPNYLQRLAKKPALDGINFATLSIKRLKRPNNLLHFSLNTKAQKGKADHRHE